MPPPSACPLPLPSDELACARSTTRGASLSVNTANRCSPGGLQQQQQLITIIPNNKQVYPRSFASTIAGASARRAPAAPGEARIGHSRTPRIMHRLSSCHRARPQGLPNPSARPSRATAKRLALAQPDPPHLRQKTSYLHLSSTFIYILERVHRRSPPAGLGRARGADALFRLCSLFFSGGLP